MKQEEIKQIVEAKFGADVSAVEFRDQISVLFPKDKALEILTFMKNTPELGFDLLSFVCGVDRYPDNPRFEIVYQLYSTKHVHRFRLKTLLEEPETGLASIDSACSVWTTADWHERETAEMYGIKFNNHPDPRKLLLPDNWAVHPLRKDFPLEGTDQTPDLPGK